MRCTWDKANAERHFAKHGVRFEACLGFDWETAFAVEDDRFDYGERRMIALGFISGRLHVLVYVRRGAWARVISLRKANERERMKYEEARQRR